MSGRPAKRRRLSSDSDADNNTVHPLNIRRPNRRRRPSNNDIQEASTSHESQNSTSQSSDEQKSNDDENGDGDGVLGTCRLRHGLNDDCLCEIFNYLGVYDLIQLCELDIYYQNLITKWIIGKKLINFTKMDPCWTTNKVRIFKGVSIFLND